MATPSTDLQFLWLRWSTWMVRNLWFHGKSHGIPQLFPRSAVERRCFNSWLMIRGWIHKTIDRGLTVDDSSWQLMTSWVFWDNDKQFVRLPPSVSVGYRRIKGDALWLLTSCSTVISHRYGKPTGFARNIIYKWWVSGFHIIPYLCWFPRVRTS